MPWWELIRRPWHVTVIDVMKGRHVISQSALPAMDEYSMMITDGDKCDANIMNITYGGLGTGGLVGMACRLGKKECGPQV